MAERKQLEMLSALMGEQGQDALQMMRRMERLKRLMGTTKPAEQIHLLPKMQEKNVNKKVLTTTVNTNTIKAATNYLNKL